MKTVLLAVLAYLTLLSQAIPQPKAYKEQLFRRGAALSCMGGPCTAPAVPGAELDEEVPGTGLTVRQMMENYSAALADMEFADDAASRDIVSDAGAEFHATGKVPILIQSPDGSLDLVSSDATYPEGTHVIVTAAQASVDAGEENASESSGDGDDHRRTGGGSYDGRASRPS